jgi:hypothetical protein
MGGILHASLVVKKKDATSYAKKKRMERVFFILVGNFAFFWGPEKKV